ncbi:MAG: ChbG/HpnK family deacetylase [Thermodesulfovibrionia bacterium]|nr:ChbG/HpnK family deacetylase [Thermodesulfovibrionia bacterium]
MGVRIIADDYGMSLEINNAISDLISRNIISKTSVMASDICTYVPTDIEKAETGLHIDFAVPMKGAIISTPPQISLIRLLFFIFINKFKAGHMIDVIKYQHDLLKSKGIKVLYLDTHKHVHIVPRILNALIFYAKNNGIKSIRCLTMERKYYLYYLRSLIRHGFLAQIPKMILLYSLGVLMKMKLDKSEIHYSNNLFLMPLALRGNYSGLLMDLLTKLKDEDAEIVTHPGLETECIGADTYIKGRYIEYSSLLKLI